MTPDKKPSPSLADLAETKRWIVITCIDRNNDGDICPIHEVGAALAVERWGAIISVRQLERGLRCTACRGRVSIDVRQRWPTSSFDQCLAFVGIKTNVGPWPEPTYTTWTEWEARHGRA